jgi:hypothetical protein
MKVRGIFHSCAPHLSHLAPEDSTMRKVFSMLAMGGLMTVIASMAVAQGQGRGGFGGGQVGIAQLIGNKGVQEEIKITDEQKEKLTEATKGLREKMREKFSELKDLPKEESGKKMFEMMAEMNVAVAKEIEPILKPEQMKRLKQIERQVMGIAAFSNKEVVKELAISDEQISKIKEVVETMTKERNEMIQEAFKNKGGNREEMREKMTALTKEATSKVEGILTDGQKTKVKELMGEKFELKMEGGFGGRTKKKDD